MISDHLARQDLRTVVESGRGTLIDLSHARYENFTPPSLLIGDISDELRRSYTSQNLVLGTSVFRITNSCVAAEGMIVIDGQMKTCNELNVDDAYVDYYHRQTEDRLNHCRIVDISQPVVLLAGPGHLVYGHWLVDFLPKLYLLHLAGFRLSRLTFLVPNDTPRFALEWLSLLSIDSRQLMMYDRASEIASCKELIVPTALRFSSRTSPLFFDAWKFLKSRVQRRKTTYSGGGESKIFVSRAVNSATLNRRSLLERSLFTEIAVKRGFHCIHPERLLLTEQISAFRNAQLICGEYGSGLHNAVFADGNCSLLIARDNAIDLGFLQSGIAERFSHRHGYMIGTRQRHDDGSFSIGHDVLHAGFRWLSDINN